VYKDKPLVSEQVRRRYGDGDTGFPYAGSNLSTPPDFFNTPRFFLSRKCCCAQKNLF